MVYNFLPHVSADRQEMLQTLGMQDQQDLFQDIPQSLRDKVQYQVLPAKGLPEQELVGQIKDWATLNQAQGTACFLGGGAYFRFVPPAVHTIASRSEFYTAYTPYQPEVSQGTLQVIYEFQTMIAELTGMDVANASVYDGGNAVGEAAFMAVRITRRKRILMAQSVHPEYRQVLSTYARGLGDVTIHEFEPERLEEIQIPGKEIACIILQHPNYFGSLENVHAIREFCTRTGALFVVSADPISLGLLEAPGHYGADITVGDIQPLGNALSFGGPYGGYMATREKYMRQLPGRLVGKAIDKAGRPCYTLTLQTREQHIRREKATSNICTNQALNVLKATVFLSLMGPQGLKQLAEVSVQRAHDLAEGLSRIPGVSLLFPNKPFFSEFAVQYPLPAQTILTGLEKQRILGGIPLEKDYPGLSKSILVSTTEMNTPDHIAQYLESIRALLQGPSQPSVSTFPAREALRP